MRQTKTREEILSFLQKHHQAHTPYEIAKTLNINPVTVYRVLEFLKSQKLVHHIVSLGKWSACQCQSGDKRDHGFLVCKKCEHVEEILVPHQCHHGRDFRCEEHVNEVIGTCAQCQ